MKLKIRELGHYKKFKSISIDIQKLFYNAAFLDTEFFPVIT
jgi:hypothetical protein